VTFDEAFTLAMVHEKGFQRNPKDRGNWTSGKIGVVELKGTKYGVSAASYPHLDIENLDLAMAKQIYKIDFWGRAGCDLVPDQIKFDLFDTAIHAGVGRAIRLLQRTVGVTDDGIIGPITMRAITDMHPLRLFSRFSGWRLDFLNDNPEQWAEFGRGWAQRIAENLKRA